jgi:hypothetical protein
LSVPDARKTFIKDNFRLVESDAQDAIMEIFASIAVKFGSVKTTIFVGMKVVILLTDSCRKVHGIEHLN